ncbi:MAG: LytTR family transcriptional regulator [Flavobacteriales bacterium]|nr:LytTR family transcriptional regulator [Flavobacteriales bacterium]
MRTSSTGQRLQDRQLALPTRDGFVVILPDDILYCKSDDNYTEFHFRDGVSRTLVISRTLKDVDQFLKHRGFIRIHQSFLVNMKHVRQYQRRMSGAELVLSNEFRLPVSRRYKQQLMGGLDMLPAKPIR